MKKTKFLFLFLFLDFICILDASQNSLYEALKTKYRNMKSFQAEFYSEVGISNSYGINLQGEIAIKNPDKWSVRLFQDKKLSFANVSNGENIWLADRFLKKGRNSRLNAIACCFSFFDNKNGVLEYLEKDQNGIVKLNLKGGVYFSSVKIVFDRKRLEIKKLTFYGYDKEVKMSISFKNIKIDGDSPDNIFEGKLMGRMPFSETLPEDNVYTGVFLYSHGFSEENEDDINFAVFPYFSLFMKYHSDKYSYFATFPLFLTAFGNDSKKCVQESELFTLLLAFHAGLTSRDYNITGHLNMFALPVLLSAYANSSETLRIPVRELKLPTGKQIMPFAVKKYEASYWGSIPILSVYSKFVAVNPDETKKYIDKGFFVFPLIYSTLKGIRNTETRSYDEIDHSLLLLGGLIYRQGETKEYNTRDFLAFLIRYKECSNLASDPVLIDLFPRLFKYCGERDSDSNEIGLGPWNIFAYYKKDCRDHEESFSLLWRILYHSYEDEKETARFFTPIAGYSRDKETSKLNLKLFYFIDIPLN